jgi:hypothetical protein
VWMAEGLHNAEARLAAITEASRQSGLRKEAMKGGASGGSAGATGGTRMDQVDAAIQQPAFVAVAAEVKRLTEGVHGYDAMEVLSVMHQGVDNLGPVHILQKALGSLTTNPVASMHEVFEVANRLRSLLPEYYTRMLAAGKPKLVKMPDEQAMGKAAGDAIMEEVVDVPVELGAHSLSYEFVKAWVTWDLKAKSFDLLGEWRELQAKLKSVDPPPRVPAERQYGRLRDFEIAAHMLSELLRIRGMAATGEGSVEGVMEWIRDSVQTAEDLNLGDGRMGEVYKVWQQCLKEVAMHCGTLRVAGPWKQQRLGAHLPEGSITVDLMDQLDLSWKEEQRLRRCHPTLFGNRGVQGPGGGYSPSGGQPGTGRKRDLNMVEDKDLTPEEWERRQANRRSKLAKRDWLGQGQDQYGTGDRTWRTGKGDQDRSDGSGKGKGKGLEGKGKGKGLEGKGSKGKGDKGSKGGKGEKGKGDAKGKGAGKGKGDRAGGWQTEEGRGWGSRSSEVHYDKSTGTLTFKPPGYPEEYYATVDEDGLTLAEFLGNKDRKVCEAFALSPIEVNGGAHCCYSRHVDHQGMDGAAHKGLTPEVRRKARQHFRLD